AIEAAKLDPILSVTEADRRKYWLRVDPDLRKCLRDLHVNFGHPTNVTLQRLLRRQGARPEAIRAVDFMSCDSCGETHRRKRPKPVRLPNKYIFNNHLQIDVFYAKDIKGQLFGFLNVVCDATGFQVVSCLGSNQGPPSTKAVLRHFLTAWSSWAGLPNSIQVDRGKEYLAHFSDYLKAYGVEQEVAGLEDVVTATAIVTQTLNLRESAKVAQIKLDTDGRVRRTEDQDLPTAGPCTFDVTTHSAGIFLTDAYHVVGAFGDDTRYSHSVKQPIENQSKIQGGSSSDFSRRRMAGYFDEFDNGSEEEETVDYTAQDPADVLLTGKAVKSEIKLKDLGPDERKKFEGSMAKIIGTRWVHTDKNAKPRMLANYLRKRTGKTKEQINKEFPFEPKSRIVVQGCQEDPTGIRSDSPTASLLAFNLVCAISVLKRWTITACDASTAYLQSKGISRTLILRPPRPPPPGISPHDLLRARGSIYGTKDAGRAWWKKLYKTLKKHSWLMSRIEAALFYLVEGGQLIGVMISHVDDLYCTGEGERYEATLNELEKELHLKIKRSEFRFCGKNVKQTNGAI
ncbi:RE2, partial [Symbiodinium necroappetens]